MKLERIRGRLPLQKVTGSKYKILVQLSFESLSEKETVYRKAKLPAETKATLLSALYLDLDDNLMQEPYVTLVGKDQAGKRFEVNVPTSRRWKGALAAAKAYLELNKTIYGY